MTNSTATLARSGGAPRGDSRQPRRTPTGGATARSYGARAWLLLAPLLLGGIAPLSAQATPDDATPTSQAAPAGSSTLEAQLRAQAQARAMERARAQANADAFGTIGAAPARPADPGRARLGDPAQSDTPARAAPSPYGSYYRIGTPWDRR